MWQNQMFSLINIDGVIQNIIVCDNYDIANQIAREAYGDNAYAVDTTLIPVGVGDTHENNIFKRGDVVINPNPTESEQIALLKTQNQELGKSVDSLTLAMAEMMGV